VRSTKGRFDTCAYGEEWLVAKSLTKQNPCLNDDLMGVYKEEQSENSASLGKEVEIHL
jgi:hypothetical protein